MRIMGWRFRRIIESDGDLKEVLVEYCRTSGCASESVFYKRRQLR